MFDEEPDVGGDQALPNANAGVKKSAKVSSVKGKDTRAQTIIQFAEKNGIPMNTCVGIMTASAKAGKVPFHNYVNLFTSAYSKI